MESIKERLTQDFNSMFEPAELLPELTEYLVCDSGTFDKLQHPLVYGVPYIKAMNNHYNQRYLLMKENTDKALTEGDFSRYLFQHERPYRLDAFCAYLNRKDVKAGEYWEMLGAIWVDSENIWQDLSLWRRLMRSTKPKSKLFMDEEDREAFNRLPKTMTVYRGCYHGKNEDGMSWTLDRDKAEWFSKRYMLKGWSSCVLEKSVRKRDIFAHITGRNESEIIIL